MNRTGRLERSISPHPSRICLMAAASARAETTQRSIVFVLIAGCAVAAMSFGPRSTMGFFLTPMSSENGWGREIFALAIAIQNLAWGVAQPFAGMIADKFGTARVMVAGGILYAAGLALMSV